MEKVGEIEPFGRTDLMMLKKKRKIIPGVESSTGAYSPAISVGDLIFVSGHGPLKPGTQEIVGRTIEEQTHQTLLNIQATLAAAKCKMNDCVKLSVYLAKMSDFDRYNGIYQKFFNQPLPARTTVQAKLWGGILVEIDAIAIKGCGKSNRRIKTNAVARTKLADDSKNR